MAEPPHRLASADAASVAALDAALHETDRFQLELDELEHVNAEVLARRLDDDDWTALHAVWRARPTAWQRCLATVLGMAVPRRAVDWLLEIIDHGEDEVALHAIDELRDLQRERSLTLPWPAPTIARVQALWSRHRGFTAGQLAQFLADLTHGSIVGRVA